MKVFLTSDFHLNSGNIGLYEGRPDGRDAKAMGERLVAACNAAAGPADVLFHVGDFILSGADRHDAGTGEDVSDGPGQDEWLKRIDTNVVLVEGNHDASNGKSMVRMAAMPAPAPFGRASVGHYPSWYPGYQGFDGTRSKPALHFCGHVHGKWLASWDGERNVVNVNVGVDVWNMRPVLREDASEVGRFVADLARARGSRRLTLTRKEYEAETAKARAAAAERRGRRRAEKLVRKGVTPEEAERRRREAMLAKGLDPDRKASGTTPAA
jgi:calcineurin-like phosphoesterase family protein